MQTGCGLDYRTGGALFTRQVREGDGVACGNRLWVIEQARGTHGCVGANGSLRRRCYMENGGRVGCCLRDEWRWELAAACEQVVGGGTAELVSSCLN
jgi:hypothetical protein